MSRKGVGKGEREVIVERAVTERATSLLNACLFAFKIGAPIANQDFVCLLWGTAYIVAIPLLYLSDNYINLLCE